MEKRVRRQFSKQFKDDAVRQVRDGGKRVSVVAKESGVASNLLARWLRESATLGDERFVGAGHQTSLEEEIRKLRRENARLVEERTILKKSRAIHAAGKSIRFRFISAHRHEHEVALMCKVLEVSRAGFYRFCARSPSNRSEKEKSILPRIRAIHFEHKRRYGSPRMHKELLRQGYACGRHQIARIMRKHGIVGRTRRRKPWFRASKPSHVANNFLARQFQPRAPNMAWVVDFTYVPTVQGWLFLAVVMDLFSHRVVGRSIGTRADEALVTAALKQAIDVRQPRAGLIHHSDQGSAYTALRYGQLLAKHCLTPSMSRRGNCHDNAVVESFFGTLEVELLPDLKAMERMQVAREILDYIDRYYNHVRLHSSLGFTSPVEHEMAASS